MITFKQDTHQYFDELGREYTPVSHVIKQYTPPFDPTGEITTRKAKEKGISFEAMKEEWRLNAKEAADWGSFVHIQCERVVRFGEVKGNWAWHLSNYINDFLWDDTLHAEMILDDADTLTCGTADLPIEHSDGSFSILDYKTNKRFRTESKYNQKMIAPFERFDYCEFNTYSFQLSIYAYMYHKKTGKPLRQLIVLWMDRVKNKIVPIELHYLKEEVEWIFEQRRAA